MLGIPYLYTKMATLATFTDDNVAVSSVNAKVAILVDGVLAMFIKYNEGLSTCPCGTPDNTGSKFENLFLNSTKK